MMKILNLESKTEEKNVFVAAKTNGSKAMLKKAVNSVLENIKSNKLKYDVFIPYFHWLMTENDLESIKALFNVFISKAKHSVAKFLGSKLPKNTVRETRTKTKATIKCPEKHGLKLLTTAHPYYYCGLCWKDQKQGSEMYGCRICDWNACVPCYSGDGAQDDAVDVELLKLFLSKVREKDLRTMLTYQHDEKQTALQWASEQSWTKTLNHVMTKDKVLLKDLLCQDEWSMIRSHVSDKEELIEIFKYCDGRVLNEEAINRLITACGWAPDSDDIRAIIMEKGKECGVTEHSMFTYVNPQNGNIPLHECMTEGNEKFFDIILQTIDLDDKDNIDFLIGYRNYNDESLLHAACKASGDRLKYTETLMDLCQFQAERETMLLARDVGGSNPVLVWLSKIKGYYSGNLANKMKEDNRMLPCLCFMTFMSFPCPRIH